MPKRIAVSARNPEPGPKPLVRNPEPGTRNPDSGSLPSAPCPLPPAPLNPIERSLVESQVVENIRTVYDPEIPVNVYDLGLIYDIQVADNRDVHIVMTLTSPMCPVAGSLPGEVECAARATPNIGEVTVELTWDPPFTIDRIPEETRLMLGFE